MKIAFILYGEPDGRSGGFLYDRYLIDSLLMRGHDVKAFSQREEGLITRIFENSSSIFHELKKYKPDLIIEDELNHTSLFLINKRIKSGIRVPIIAVVHHLRSEEKMNLLFKIIARKIEALFLGGCDAYIINSKNTLQTVNKLLKTEIESYKIIYPGKDNLPHREGSRVYSGSIKLLFAGNIIPRKNLDMVLRVLKKIAGRKWQLNICGSEDNDPSYMKILHRLSAEFEENKQVIYNGRVTNRQLSEFFAEAHILISPSDWEGFGIIYLEALKAGVVPIASNNGGATEIIEDGISGFLLSPGDDDQLERLLRDLIDNPEVLRKMSVALLEKASTFKNWNETMDEAVRFIERVV